MRVNSACSKLRAGCAFVVMLWLVGCKTAEPKEIETTETKPAEAKPAETLVDRGAYLVTVMGCDDCHSPKVFTSTGPMTDSTRRLSGHPQGEQLPDLPQGLLGPEGWGALTNNGLTAWYGPWGMSFSTNLTPHHTGLGAWTETHFVQTMRTGKHLGAGRPVLPPMPWPSIGKLSDDDLKSIFAYLRTLPPIDNVVPQPFPPTAAPNGAASHAE